MNIESVTQALFELPLAQQVQVMGALDKHIGDVLGYIDPNIEIAEQRLQDYRAGKMDAKSWDEVRTQIFG